MNGWKEVHCIYQLMNHHQGFVFLLYNNYFFNFLLVFRQLVDLLLTLE